MPVKKNRESEKPKVVEKELEIKNRLGLHARPASMLARLTAKYESDIYIKKDQEEVNGKSIMRIITLAASRGAISKINVIGDDAQEAVDAVSKLIESKFGEE